MSSQSAPQAKELPTVRKPDPSPGQGKHRAKNRRRKKALRKKTIAMEGTARNKEKSQQEDDRAKNSDGDRSEGRREEDGDESDGGGKESDGGGSRTEGECHEKRVLASQGNTDIKETLTLKKRKRKRKEIEHGGLVRITTRGDNSKGSGDSGVWYYHLKMITSPSPPLPQSTPPDLLTWRTFLTSSLTRLFGIQGASCLVDILKLEDWECWVKVQGSHGDFGAGIGSGGFGVAVGGYIGTLAGDEAESGSVVSVRVVKGGQWLVGVASGGESDLWAA